MFVRTIRQAASPARAGARYLQTKPNRPWSTHRLTTPPPQQQQQPKMNPEQNERTSRVSEQLQTPPAGGQPLNASPNAEAKPAKPRRRPLKPLKAAITLTPKAVEHLQRLLESPEPKLIRIGVRNRGCSGLTYNLEYVDRPGKFDEEVVQDGVRVLIDSKALFSVIGSQMDWVDDKLTSRFVFNNPNSKGECGCGESFMV